MKDTNPTACMIMIGNELLSGRTQDKNLSVAARALNMRGVTMARALVVRDEPADIADAVNTMRTQYDYVITSGGIGPTHDDITSDCVAKAFGVRLYCDASALQSLQKHYNNDDLADARRKMAFVPEGSALIDNPVSGAPGFRIENVFVLAGVPSIFEVMMEHVCTMVKGGTTMLSREMTVWAGESMIAPWLTDIQDIYDDVEIGCYPLMRDGRFGATVVLRSTDEERLDQARDACQEMMAFRKLDVATS